MEQKISGVGIKSLCWMGVRTARFHETVAFYREVMGLEIIRETPDAIWFHLSNGVELHVYSSTDTDHTFFGLGPVIGLEVANFAAARARMIEAGVEFIGDIQQDGKRLWNHFRGPDGNIYEIMGTDDATTSKSR